MNPPVLAPRRTAAQILFSQVCEPVTRQLPFVLEPAAGFEPATSGLQVRCSTAELHRLGAGGRNRTPIPGLEGRCSTIELHPHRAPDFGRSLHLHRFSGIARRLATGSITADFATARPTSKRLGQTGIRWWLTALPCIVLDASSLALAKFMPGLPSDQTGETWAARTLMFLPPSSGFTS